MEEITKEMSIKKYLAYKDSGAEWLGKIPKQWRLGRLGSYFDERREKVSDKDFEPLSVTKQGILPQLDNAAKTNDGDNRKLVKTGDFVINSRSDRKGSSGISDRDGSVSLINIVLQPKGINPFFCNYLLKSNSFVEEFYRMGHGIVADLWTTRYDEMKSITIAIPEPEEQIAITHFLDSKIALIEKAITIKQKQIKLLEERRQTMIHRAVTHGLGQTIKYKNSGLEWIAEVPDNWEIEKLKYHFDLVSGGTPFKGNQNYWNGNIPWVSPKDMKVNFIRTTEDFVTDKALIKSKIKLIPKDTLLMVVRSGILQRLIPVAISSVDLTINQDLKAFIPTGKLCTEYLYYFIKGCDSILRNHCVKQVATVESIEIPLLKNFYILIPSHAEQLNIIKFIKGLEVKIDFAISTMNQEIEKLREYKLALVDRAVTGKIKVN